METITVRKDPINMLPCTNCGNSTAEHLDCPACGKEFCGTCFLEIPEGDGNSCHCPHCHMEVLLPPIS
ncbi:MAG: hypothetical protein WCV85_01410 [Patescibacteria group bacterium]|jgi:hypothetical protein